jgi:hypothetical protein
MLNPGLTNQIASLPLPDGASTSAKQDEIIALLGGGTTGNDIYLDEASATITYVGTAVAGSATSSAVWSIKRLNSASGLIVTWANSDPTANKIWDNRATYTY